MEKQNITEEMGIHKAWTEEARQVKTVDDLAKFVTHLIEDYNHDYGTIVHAMNAAMLAAFHTVDESPHGGITGFQAGCLGWMMVKKFLSSSELTRLVDYENLLYPQYEYKFTSISKETWDKVQKKAKEKLKENTLAHPKVVAHWETIANGEIPFGLKVNDED